MKNKLIILIALSVYANALAEGVISDRHYMAIPPCEPCCLILTFTYNFVSLGFLGGMSQALATLKKEAHKLYLDPDLPELKHVFNQIVEKSDSTFAIVWLLQNVFGLACTFGIIMPLFRSGDCTDRDINFMNFFITARDLVPVMLSWVPILLYSQVDNLLEYRHLEIAQITETFDDMDMYQQFIKYVTFPLLGLQALRILPKVLRCSLKLIPSINCKKHYRNLKKLFFRRAQQYEEPPTAVAL